VPIARGGIPRASCSHCGWIDWRNPKAGVAVILQDEAGRVLLVRRTAPPAGAWCIPCGNVEWEEDVRLAARREALEETGFEVAIGPVYAVLSNAHDPDARSVGIWFRGRITGGSERPGGDVDRTGWFLPSEPPEPLAFPTDRLVLAALAAGRPSCEPEGPP
jgi:ADP-ribose pyrophosphatase YjhB (NUDIX family)